MAQAEPQHGLVVLVGAGPAGAGLICVEGLGWLRSAQVVIYDRLVSPALLELPPPNAERIYVGKTPAGESISQDRINELLVAKCRAGKLVVRLKGGDPLVFGRGGEEAEALAAAGLPFRIVPGVTAAVAAAAYAGIPLTDRRTASSVAFVTGREDPAKQASAINWGALAGIDTLVFYMGVGKLPEIAERLIGSGRPGGTPAAVVERAGTLSQHTVVATLETIAERARSAGVQPPAVVIVGDVVKMRDRLAWLERLPLFGRTVLVTRARRQASQLAEQLGWLGAEVIEAPAVLIEPPESFEAVDEALCRLGQFQWLVFTSANGVASLVERMDRLFLDARALGGVRIAAVGPATTKALRERFLTPDLVPTSYTTEALAEALCACERIRGKRVMLARADIATPVLAERLRQAGALVEEIVVYRTARPAALPADAAEALRSGRADWITFTSSSTVENFMALAEPEKANLSKTKLAAIGPVTAETLRQHGLKPTVIAEPHTIDAMVSAIVRQEEQGKRTG